MKYISLLSVAELYGEVVKNQHDTQRLNTDGCTGQRWLEIIPHTDETGQVWKNIRQIRQAVDKIFLHFIAPNAQVVCATVPPIMEIEYMKQALPFGADIFDVMEHTAYLYIIIVLLQWTKTSDWSQGLDDGCIQELEDIKDALFVMEKNELTKRTCPKYAAYQLKILYGHDFSELFHRCTAQTLKMDELYYHLPVLLSMFLLDEHHNFETWSENALLNMTDEIKNQVNEFCNYDLVSTGYSYGMGRYWTTGDRDFMKIVFNYIMKEINKKKNQPKAISYQSYQRFNGPDRISTKIKLVDMSVSWDEEIERAEREKQKQQEG